MDFALLCTPVADDGNPIRAEEIRNNRDSKINYIADYLKEENLYLREHKKAKPEVSLRKIEEKIVMSQLQMESGNNKLEKTKGDSR